MMDVCLVGAFFLFRGNRDLMNALVDTVTIPFKRAMARICAMTDISVMEVTVKNSGIQLPL